MRDTRDRVLDAAERLFAKKGVAAVSLREINGIAGISQGVLHYHFKGRDGLIEALLERRLPAVTADRRDMVERLRAHNAPPSIRELLEIIVLPLARVAIEQGTAGRRFIQVLGRLSSERNPIFMKFSSSQFARVGLQDLIPGQLPRGSMEVFELRIGMAMHAIYGTLGELDDLAYSWQSHARPATLEPRQVVDALLDFLCEGFSGRA